MDKQWGVWGVGFPFSALRCDVLPCRLLHAVVQQRNSRVSLSWQWVMVCPSRPAQDLHGLLPVLCPPCSLDLIKEAPAAVLWVPAAT